MTINEVEAALARHPDIKLAYVFGSVARNTAKPDSDVDVAVLAATPPGCGAQDPVDFGHRRSHGPPRG